jgi:Uma2 family endonuclease
MGPEEQARVVEALPGEVTWDEMAMPEGDKHFGAKVSTRDMLQGYFRDRPRGVYLGAELPIYYPAEPRFAPDLLAVLDVETHEREKWVVSYEGKGLDWVMEVHVGGDRKKDAVRNVERYARLGIPEYFIYDRSREVLEAYRLPSPQAREYTPMKPKHGRYRSAVLGLEFEVVDEQLRLWAGDTLLLESAEMLERAEKKLTEERRRRKEEAHLRHDLERRIAQLQAEMERVRHSR